MGDGSPERRSGCGLLSAVFGGRHLWPRKSSPGSFQTSKSLGNDLDDEFLDPSNPEKIKNRQTESPPARPGPNYNKSLPVYRQNQGPGPHATNQRRHQNLPRNGTAQPKSQQGNVQARKVPQAGLGLSGELDCLIMDNQRSKGAGNLVRASSGNVMLYGSLGNLKQPGNTGAEKSTDVLDHFPKSANEDPMPIDVEYSARNAAKKTDGSEKPVPLCRALSTRMDPEELKILGNEDYKNGKFAEALALYEAAISIDPNKAPYRSNKSAALTCLGRLLEAAFECREAIRIDPLYQRAHNRLATLYVRLGEPDKGLYHFKQAGPEADPDAINMARKVQNHLNKCTEAKMQRNWNAQLKESGLSIAVGADSAPLIIALKAEALLKLNKHQEAIEMMVNSPDFGIDDCTKFFGPIASASLLLIHAQVYMVEGRFDEASAAAQRASRLDSNNEEADTIVRRTRAVTIARSNGNNHFKAARYKEASESYEEGLKHDPCNALLLSNRAACWSKLELYDKAIQDCNAALNVRPDYRKARLRRADCYAKMEKWEICAQDCEVLVRENPDNEEAGRLLNEAKAQVNRRQGR